MEKHPTNKDSKVVKYRCLCGNVSSTDLRNLKKPDRQSQCPKCQNNNYKIDYELLQKHFQDRKFIHCKPCSYKQRQLKTKATNLKIYGVENPMQNKDIKNKQK